MEHTIPVEAGDLLDIYESTDDEQVREQIIDLLVATPTAPLEDLYPEVQHDIDAAEVTRQVAGVEDPIDAVNWVKDNGGDAHVSTCSGFEDQPYVVGVDDAPPGWERDPENENYLRKK